MATGFAADDSSLWLSHIFIIIHALQICLLSLSAGLTTTVLRRNSSRYDSSMRPVRVGHGGKELGVFRWKKLKENLAIVRWQPWIVSMHVIDPLIIWPRLGTLERAQVGRELGYTLLHPYKLEIFSIDNSLPAAVTIYLWFEHLPLYPLYSPIIPSHSFPSMELYSL